MHLFFDRNEEKIKERTERGKKTQNHSNTKKLFCVLPLESLFFLLVLKQAIYTQGRRESWGKIKLVPAPTCNLGKSGCTKCSWQLLWLHRGWRAMSLDQQWHYRLRTQMQGKIMTDLECNHPLWCLASLFQSSCLQYCLWLCSHSHQVLSFPWMEYFPTKLSGRVFLCVCVS